MKESYVEGLPSPCRTAAPAPAPAFARPPSGLSGQWWSGRSRRSDAGGIRAGPEKEPVSDLEKLSKRGSQSLAQLRDEIVPKVRGRGASTTVSSDHPRCTERSGRWTSTWSTEPVPVQATRGPQDSRLGMVERGCILRAPTSAWVEWLSKRLDDRSRMNREVHVRFWEGLGCNSPGLLTERYLRGRHF